MQTGEPVKLRILRVLLALDAGVLFLLGVAFILWPKQVEAAFHFPNLPDGVSYLIGLWGCVFATLALGYAVAATDPVRHVAWVQVGIARGFLECLFGFTCVNKGIVTWNQAAFGIVVAAGMTVAYLFFYPGGKAGVAGAAIQAS